MGRALSAAAGASGHQRVLEGQQRQPRGVQAARDSPAHDPAGVHIGDERDLAEARQNPDIGDVSDPQLLRTSRSEIAFDEVRAVVRAACGLCRDWPTPPTHSLKPCCLH